MYSNSSPPLTLLKKQKELQIRIHRTPRELSKPGALQFEDEYDLVVGLKHIVQRDDVGVVEVVEDLDLLQNLLAEQALATAAVGPALDDELGRILDAGRLLLATAYYCELTAVAWPSFGLNSVKMSPERPNWHQQLTLQGLRKLRKPPQTSQFY